MESVNKTEVSEDADNRINLELRNSPNERFLGSPHKDSDEDLNDIHCGFYGWSPTWLQIFASKKSYILMHSFVGLYEASLGSYYYGIISTVEKRFKLPSTASGIISSCWDVGSMCSSLFIAYFVRSGHKTRWVALGIVLVAISSFLRYLPHLIYGPGEEITTATYSSSSDNLCPNNSTNEEKCSLNAEGTVAFWIFAISQLLLGVGVNPWYTLGSAYLDDNVKKNKFPFILGVVDAIYNCGPALGYLLSFYTLSVYVDPFVDTLISEDDPRWIGAWHLAWIPFGCLGLIMAIFLALFPKILPREAERQKALIQEKQKDKPLTKDFKQIVLRLIRNPVLMFNSTSLIFYILGFIGFWIFLPKYMETQFRVSASDASLITGGISLFCTSFGTAFAGMIITKFKPSSKTLAAWSVATETLEVIIFMCLPYLTCFKNDLHGQLNIDGSWNLSAECNIGCNCSPLMYSPVCSFDSYTTYFSPCHAGCTSRTSLNDTILYNHCNCIGNIKQATEQECPSTCGYDLIIFIALLCVMETLGSTGRPGNIILQFRAVHPDDKAVSIALSEGIICALAWIPGPIIYGMILGENLCFFK